MSRFITRRLIFLSISCGNVCFSYLSLKSVPSLFLKSTRDTNTHFLMELNRELEFTQEWEGDEYQSDY